MRILTTVVLVVLATLTVTAKPAADAKTAARAASDAFIKLVDAGEYGSAYASCATALKSKATQGVFAHALAGLRSKLGRNTLRHFLSATPRSDLPGAPPGKYIVFIYVSDFEKQKGLKEIVTPMREKNGAWKVSGYYVQP